MLRNGCGTLHILWHILWLGFLMPVGNVGLAGQPRPQNQRGLAPGTLAACCASSKTPAMVDETAQPPGRHDSKSMGTRARHARKWTQPLPLAMAAKPTPCRRATRSCFEPARLRHCLKLSLFTRGQSLSSAQLSCFPDLASEQNLQQILNSDVVGFARSDAFKS